MRLSAFTHDFLLLLSGPLIWAAHFLAIYGFAGIVCARAVRWPGADWTAWVLLLAGVVAAGAIAACLLARPRSTSSGPFLRWLTRGLGLLALVAIAWETAAVFLLPACPAAS